MKANELRIGNLVLLFKGVSDFGPEWKEYSIDSGFDLYKLDENDCSDIDQIPLTEEWLLKFGFELNQVTESFSIYYNNNFDYRIEYYKESNDFWFDELLKVKHVHQLQNLYFALTGNELEIK